MAKILLIEDQIQMSKMIVDWLEKEQHIVDVVHDGAEGFDRLQFYSYDLTIVDIDLPSMSGPEICTSFRRKGGKIPVLMLTGKTDIADKITSFDAGADDYLTKPFHPLELTARVRALLARPAKRNEEVLTAGDLQLDTRAHTVQKAGRPIHLMPREFALLELFMRHPGETFSSEALLNTVWSSESDASSHTVKAQVAKLRRKIDDEDAESLILTLHGIGYKLKV